jgi:hypothetical protein
VQFDGYVQIHSFHLYFFSLADPPHLLSSEMSLYGFEYLPPVLPEAPGGRTRFSAPRHPGNTGPP